MRSSGPVPPGQLHSEILEQSEALEHLLEVGWADARRVAARVRAFKPDWVLIAARGSSDNAARYAQYVMGLHNGWVVALALPSLVSLYHGHPRIGRALVIGISQSGQSPDIVAVLEEARSQGALTLSVTNDLASPLALACELGMPIHAGVEHSIAATKTYTCELLALAMLSSAISGSQRHESELTRVPQWARAMTASRDTQIVRIAESAVDVSRIIVAGRGFNYSTCFEIALKLQEMCGIMSLPYSAPDLLHGPCAMLDDKYLAIVVMPKGPTAEDASRLFDLLEERKVPIVAISNHDEVLRRATFAIEIPFDVPEWISPMIAVIAGQLFAHSLCLALGMNPNAPRGLSKVTLTR